MCGQSRDPLNITFFRTRIETVEEQNFKNVISKKISRA